jgi:hypothetical protein
VGAVAIYSEPHFSRTWSAQANGMLGKFMRSKARHAEARCDEDAGFVVAYTSQGEP